MSTLDINKMAIRDDITDLKVSAAKTQEHVAFIRKALEGNGKTGLIKEVEDNKNFRLTHEAQLRVFKFIAGGGLLSSAVALVMHFL